MGSKIINSFQVVFHGFRRNICLSDNLSRCMRAPIKKFLYLRSVSGDDISGPAVSLCDSRAQRSPLGGAEGVADRVNGIAVAFALYCLLAQVSGRLGHSKTIVRHCLPRTRTK